MDRLKPCYYSTRLIDKLKVLDKQQELNFALINKAILWAKHYHDGQFRKSGEPFYTHPLEVAYMISEYKLTTNVIVTSILHDIVEDTEVTAGMILDNFGRRIEQMVDMLTRDRPDGTKLSVEQILNNAYQKNDKEVLLIKLTDRLHNVLTLNSMSKKKQQKKSSETINNFLFFAMYLENIDLEKELSLKSHSIISDKDVTQKINNMYNLFSEQEGVFLVFSNTIK